MELWLDTVDYEIIKNASQLGVLTGVTTNPSSWAKANDCPEKVLEVLLDIQAGYVAAQVTASDCSEMLKQAERLTSLCNRIVVKIPASPEGFRAIALLNQDGVQTLATSIFDVRQVIVSAIVGATYAIPHFSCMAEDVSSRFMQLYGVMNEQKYKTKIMASEVGSAEQFVDCVTLGVPAITVSSEVYAALFLPSERMEEGLSRFAYDWALSSQAAESSLFAR